jgi:plastocyanin
MKSSLFIGVLAAVLSSGVASATSYTIRFGGGFGNTYEPKKLTVAVGDTIIWRGDFVSHPLQSTSVPTGADPFAQDTGTVYTPLRYVVRVAGVYDYECAIHGSSGMTGQFTATTAGVSGSASSDKAEIMPQAVKDQIGVRLTLSQNSNVSARLHDALGRVMIEIMPEVRDAGVGEIRLDSRGLPAGSYFLEVRMGVSSYLLKVAKLE